MPISAKTFAPSRPIETLKLAMVSAVARGRLGTLPGNIGKTRHTWGLVIGHRQRHDQGSRGAEPRQRDYDGGAEGS